MGIVPNASKNASAKNLIFLNKKLLVIKVTSFMPFFGVLRGAGAISYPTSLSFFVFRGQSASKRLKTDWLQTQKHLTFNKQLFFYKNRGFYNRKCFEIPRNRGAYHNLRSPPPTEHNFGGCC
jgi:hypothetical protein